jgi:hypothetical protein
LSWVDDAFSVKFILIHFDEWWMKVDVKVVVGIIVVEVECD